MNKNYSEKICPQCRGWGIQHIPVQSNYQTCQICQGKSVILVGEDRELFWGKQTIFDTRPSYLTKKIFQNERLNTYIFLLFAIVLVIILMYLISGINIFSIIFSGISNLIKI